MGNTKAVGVAYADPDLDSATISGALTAGTASVSGALTAGTVTSTASSGAIAANANGGVYFLSVAITANVTASTAPAGSLGLTSNATGRGKLFVSDGSKWQFAAIS